MKTKTSKLGILVIAAALLLGCIYAAISDGETVPQTQTILKGYFVSGARPSSTNYDELIDTTFWYILQCYTNAVYAAQSAQAAQTVWQAVGNLTITNSGSLVGITVTNGANLGTVTVTNNGSVTLGGTSFHNYKITVNYAAPFPGTNYLVNFSCPAAPVLGTNYSFLPTTVPLINENALPSTTNFIFNVDSYNTTFVSGLNIRFTVQ